MWLVLYLSTPFLCLDVSPLFLVVAMAARLHKTLFLCERLPFLGPLMFLYPMTQSSGMIMFLICPTPCFSRHSMRKKIVKKPRLWRTLKLSYALNFPAGIERVNSEENGLKSTLLVPLTHIFLSCLLVQISDTLHMHPQSWSSSR